MYSYCQGRLRTLTLPDGVVLTHSYDPLGRLAEHVASDGTVHYRYTYDLQDNLLKAEDLIQNVVVERAYDVLARLVYEKQAGGYEVAYAYDQQNRVTEFNFPDGSLSYTYTPTGFAAASRHKQGGTLLHL